MEKRGLRLVTILGSFPYRLEEIKTLLKSYLKINIIYINSNIGMVRYHKD